jgi:hypothetical protein
MPGYDGTGPMSMGPMTGGARGRCNPDSMLFGWGGGRPQTGMGRGRGHRNMFCTTGLRRWMRSGPFGPGNYPASYTKEQEKGFLKDQAAALKSELDGIEDRLRTLKS